MVDFNQADRRFTYRAAAVTLHNNHVLLTLASSMDYWYLPGGRVELGETSLDALRREMREELDEEVQIERLIWIAESFVQIGEKSVHGRPALPRHPISYLTHLSAARPFS